MRERQQERGRERGGERERFYLSEASHYKQLNTWISIYNTSLEEREKESERERERDRESVKYSHTDQNNTVEMRIIRSVVSSNMESKL